MFRFTIRDVPWLTVVVVLTVGWVVERGRYDRLMSEVKGGLPIRFDSSGELVPRSYPPAANRAK
jgi:hypothetical protein